MIDDRALHAKVCDLIRAGSLPAAKPDRIWGGPGAGNACAVCGTVVSEDEVELELEFTSRDGLGTHRPHLHVRCFAILEAESQKLRAAQAASAEWQTPPRRGGGGGGSAWMLRQKA